MPRSPSQELLPAAELRWEAVVSARPELASAVELQRRLITRIVELKDALESGRLPRLSLPAKYLAAKLTRGVPVFSGEPIPLPVPLLRRAVLELCRALSAGGAAEVADHIHSAIDEGTLEAGSLLSASFSRDQDAIRTGATHRGLAPDLVWLVAELAVGPYTHALQRRLFGAAEAELPEELTAALAAWNEGYCPACGSWPAMAEVVSGHRTMRCSFCAAAWELNTYACVYCAEEGSPFVTAAPDEDRKDRRIEVCGSCTGYLKTVDLEVLSPFPLLSLGDLETMDLDVAAMQHGYARPPLKEFTRKTT